MIGCRAFEKRNGPRKQRIRAAQTTCASNFNAIHDELAWFVAHTPPAEARARLEQMLAPFQALLARYPAPPDATEAAEPAEEAPAVAHATGASPVPA